MSSMFAINLINKSPGPVVIGYDNMETAALLHEANTQAENDCLNIDKENISL